MTIDEITKQIAVENAIIAEASKRKGEFEASALDWRNSKSKCAGTKSKKAECEAYKEQQAVSHDNSARAEQTKIDQSKARIVSLNDTLKAANKAQLDLASQGKSLSALEIAATGQAEAVKQAAVIKSTAEAEAVKTTAATDSQSKMILIVVLVVVVLAVGVIFLMKKKAKPTIK